MHRASRAWRIVIDASSDAAVADSLLLYLQRLLANPSIAFAEAPRRLTGGFDTRVYGFQLSGAPAQYGMPLVLRVFRHDVGTQPARFESAVLGAAAAQHFPVPRVLSVETDAAPLGAAFIVMERVPGRPMVEAFFSPTLFRLPALLAATHRQLHQLDPIPFRRAIDAVGCSVRSLSVDDELEQMEHTIDCCALRGLLPGMRWLIEHRVADTREPVVCHGDFHPLNILIDGMRVSGVIDWSQAHLHVADRAYDVGATVALMSHGPVRVPPALGGAAALLRRALVRRYVRAYVAACPLDAGALRYYEALRCLGFLVEANTYLQAAAGVIAPVSKPTAFAAAAVLRQIVARFRELTDVSVSVAVGH